MLFGEEGFIGELVDPGDLLASEAADPVGREAEFGHEAVEPLGAEAAVVAPFLLAHVPGVAQLDEALFKQPDVEIDVPLDGPEAVVAHEDEGGVWGQLARDGAEAGIEIVPESDEAVADGVEFWGAGEAVLGIPGVPEFVLDAVGGHEVVDEQVPGMLVEQELDGAEVVVEVLGEAYESLLFAAAVVDGGIPGLVRLSEVCFEFGERGGVAGEVGRVGRREEISEEQSWERAGGIAHGHGGGHAGFSVAAGDFPEQFGVDGTRGIDLRFQWVMFIFQKLEDAVFTGVFARHHAGPGDGAERWKDGVQGSAGALVDQAREVGHLPCLDEGIEDIPSCAVQAEQADFHAGCDSVGWVVAEARRVRVVGGSCVVGGCVAVAVAARGILPGRFCQWGDEPRYFSTIEVGIGRRCGSRLCGGGGIEGKGLG